MSLKEEVRSIQKRLGSTPFPDNLQGIADDANVIIARQNFRIAQLKKERFTAADVEAAVRKEREACAVIADEMRDNCGLDQDGNPYVDEGAHLFGSGVANVVGRAIRARTTQEEQT